jgi:uncharacterized delta-60 repeat protein
MMLRLCLRFAAALLLSGSLAAQDSWQAFPQLQPFTHANLWSIAYGERTLVTVGEEGTILSYSYDDHAWLPHQSGTGVWLVGVGYGNGRFVAVGDRGTILTSDDLGGTWTPRVSGTATRLNAAVYGGGRWIVVGEQGLVLTSTDGATWQSAATLGNGFLRALAYGQGRFLIGGAGGTLYMTTDAATFARVPIATTADIEGAAITPDTFLVVGSAGLRAAARDLNSWVLSDADPETATITFRGAAVRNGNEVSAVGEFAAATYLASSQLRWAGVFGKPQFLATAVTAGLNEVVAVGFGGNVARSSFLSAIPLVSSSGRFATFGEDVRLHLAGGAPLAFQWTRNGSDIPGATDAELVLRNVTEGDGAGYGLRYTTATGVSTIIGGTTFTVVPGGRPEVRDPNFNSALPTLPALVVPQPDGKLLVAGPFSVSTNGGPTAGIARLNRDGTLDLDFRAGSGIGVTSSIAAFVPAPDGRIYVRGSFSNIGDATRPGLARLLANGSVDPNFVPESSVASPSNLALASDGSVYVETTLSNGSRTVSRLRGNGTIDTAFGPLANHRLIAVDSSGRVLAMRLASIMGMAGELVRYLPNGSLDPAYAITPATFFYGATGGRDDFARAMLTERGLYAAQLNFTRFTYSYSFVRYKPDGGLDPAYARPVITNATPSDQRTLAFRTDGGFWIVRRTDSATFADSYSPDGLSEMAYATLPDLSGYSLQAIAPDGSLIAATNPDPLASVLIRIRPLTGANSRLTNLSVRSFIASSSEPLIVGFVTSGTGSTRALVRAIGPGLATFNVADYMPDPQLTLALDGSAALANDQWSNSLVARFTAVGAFPLTPGSNDAALESSVGAGNYTLIVAPVAGSAPGTTLAELYETADPAATRRFVNVSARGPSSPERPHIVGFSISGDLPRKILVRAAGPALARFDVRGLLADPKLTLYRSDGVAIWENNDWSATPANTTAVATAGGNVGAFGFSPGSKDAATVVTLAPGSYTAVVSGNSTELGIALLEVYDVP